MARVEYNESSIFITGCAIKIFKSISWYLELHCHLCG